MYSGRRHFDLVLPCLCMAWLIHAVAGGGQVLAQGRETAQTSPKSAPAALAIYSDAANLQNNREFDLAIEQWSALLKDFADDPLADHARHYLGVCQLQLKQYDKAAQTLSDLVAGNPKFEFLEDTYLNLGWAQYSHALADHPDWLAKAEVTFAALADKFPQGPYVDQALFYRGESLYQQGKRREALACYNRLINEHPQSKLRADAIYALGVTHQELEEYAQAGEVCGRFLKDFPQHQLVSEVRMRSGEIELALGNPVRAEGLFGQAASAEGFASADYAALRQAYSAALQDKHQRAAELYTGMVERFPESRRPGRGGDVGRPVVLSRRRFPPGGEMAATGGPKRRQGLGGSGPLAVPHLAQAETARAGGSAGCRPLAQGRRGPVPGALEIGSGRRAVRVARCRAESLELYRQIAQQHSKDALAAQALYNAAYAALDLKRFDDGIELTQRFLKQHAQDPLLPDVLYVRAECLLLKGQYAEAEKLYQRLLADHAEHAEAGTWRLRVMRPRPMRRGNTSRPPTSLRPRRASWRPRRPTPKANSCWGWPACN